MPLNDSVDQARYTLRFLWVAFVAAVFIYNVVARSDGLLPSDSIAPMFMNILIGLSVIMFLAVVGFQFKLGNSLGSDVTSIFVPKLIQFALAESIAVYGLVLTFIDGNDDRLLIFSGVSLLCLLIAYPRR